MMLMMRVGAAGLRYAPGLRCIKMRNTDILRLFDLVSVGTPVVITE